MVRRNKVQALICPSWFCTFVHSKLEQIKVSVNFQALSSWANLYKGGFFLFVFGFFVFVFVWWHLFAFWGFGFPKENLTMYIVPWRLHSPPSAIWVMMMQLCFWKHVFLEEKLILLLHCNFLTIHLYEYSNRRTVWVVSS